MTPAPPIPAATLIVMHDRPAGAPEILMVERARTMAFAPGALVFPGGRVDPGDYALAATIGHDPDGEAAARVAAIRETLEEVGLAIGLTPPPDRATIEAWRTALATGVPFADLLHRAGDRIDLDGLVAFARWLPAHLASRTFDTRFFLTRVETNAVEAKVDGTENTRLVWASAAAVLDDADAGRIAIIYPTRRNLERLATFAAYDAAVADARSHPVRTITPFVEHRDGEPHLCIPEDMGYPVTSEPMSTAMRG